MGLKNVVVKYVELCGPPDSNVEQHERLVPVIATCLNLSPEERKRMEKKNDTSWSGWLSSASSSFLSAAAAAAAQNQTAPDIGTTNADPIQTSASSSSAQN